MAININPQFTKTGIQNAEALNTVELAPIVPITSQAQRGVEASIIASSGQIGSAYNGLTGNSVAISNSRPSTSGVQTVATSAASTSSAGSSGGGGSSTADNILNALAIGSAAVALGSKFSNIASGVAEAQGQVKTAAGQFKDLISRLRGRSIPAGGELFSGAENEKIQVAPSSNNDWRVKLNTAWSLFPGNREFQLLQNTGGMVFPITPQINLSYRANYTAVDPVHSNYPFMAYKNSAIEDITISGQFPVTNAADAEYWLAVHQFLKTCTKMFFGASKPSGNPPLICSLSGYGPFIFNNIPVVVKNYTIDLPDAVDYISDEPPPVAGVDNTSARTPNWVPALSTISITVSPIYSREKLRKFNLQDYARGAYLTANGGVL